MPRVARPYIHQGWYCTSSGSVQHRKLCPADEGFEKAAALLKQHLMLVRPEAFKTLDRREAEVIVKHLVAHLGKREVLRIVKSVSEE